MFYLFFGIRLSAIGAVYGSCEERSCSDSIRDPGAFIL